MSDIKSACEDRMKKTLSALKDEFAGIRTGRASPSILDKLRVDYYGEKTPIAQVATVSVPEARLIVVQPWDKATIGEIEKAILKSDLGLNPSNDGKVIRISIPPLTEERRKDLVKHAKASAEQSRVALRNIRRDGLEDLKKLKDSGTPEDTIKKSEDELQKLTDSYVAHINKTLEDKEKEIMEV
ncbi:MAG TPA: ribosome recycling factor [Spirochaetales bacterium]|nr:ribosome recycling factor [Spirochaetales bacterium]MBP7262567.1 ribosome recycling factor [Spirochaetia bacterium]HPE37382.1 ribosome recycling factor [Spirochaetales bacterium]